MNQLSDRINNLSTSATLAMAAKARELRAEGKDIIGLSLGEPDFNTPDFVKEAAIKAINDNYNRFKSDGYEVVGVSADSEKVQKNFSDKFSFDYSLLCDVDKKIISSYGAWGQKKMYGKEYMGIIRKTIIIDESGKIEQIIEKVKTKEHSSQILN